MIKLRAFNPRIQYKVSVDRTPKPCTAHQAMTQRKEAFKVSIEVLKAFKQIGLDPIVD